MPTGTLPGGTFALADDITVNRVGYDAMQLAGPGVFGPPADRTEAVGVLREAVALGIDHIDTSGYYGPYVTNEIIREALHPYPEGLTIVTKIGARRDADGNWPHARSSEELRRAVHENLEHLGLDVLDVVNLRMGGFDGPEPGDSPVVCVQSFYNLANRGDDALIDQLAGEGIAYVAYFPLGGFTPLQSDTLGAVAARLGATSMSVALAWLLRRSPNLLLIPGRSSVAHLRENVAGAGLELSAEDVAELDTIAG